MKTKRVFIVQYNDCYGNGTTKNLEAVIESEDDFAGWLELHNEGREEPENKEEFTLIPIEMFNFNDDRFSCQNCGGGFSREEMDFGDDTDLCKNCTHRSFNEAPYNDY